MTFLQIANCGFLLSSELLFPDIKREDLCNLDMSLIKDKLLDTALLCALFLLSWFLLYRFQWYSSMHATKVSCHNAQHKLALKCKYADIMYNSSNGWMKVLHQIQNVCWYTKSISVRIKVLIVFVLRYCITCNPICRTEPNLLTRSLRWTRYFVKYFQWKIKFRYHSSGI